MVMSKKRRRALHFEQAREEAERAYLHYLFSEPRPAKVRLLKTEKRDGRYYFSYVELKLYRHWGNPEVRNVSGRD